MASSYQIGTQAVEVEVVFASGPNVAGEMFLRPAGLRPSETAAERLNDGAPFFPLRMKDGAVVLLGKAQVRYVVTPPVEDDTEAADDRTSVPQLLVTAELDSGETLTGVFFVDLPPGHVRSLDYANEARGAFLVLAHLDREYLINRTFIKVLRDVSS